MIKIADLDGSGSVEFENFMIMMIVEMRKWYDNGDNDNKEILIINKLIENGTDSIDVGVYRGVHSYEMAKYSKNVHSFEPNPIIFKELKKYLPRIKTSCFIWT